VASLLGIAVVVGSVLHPALAADHDGAPYMPDLLETLLSTMGASHLRQLTGAWSRVGLYHPGPAWFYWAAPFVRLADDRPWGLVLAAASAAAAGVAIVWWAIERAEGHRSAIVAAGVLAVGVARLSPVALAMPWNPVVGIVPAAAGLVCLASTWVRPSLRVALVGIACGSFVAQAHLGALPLGGAIVVGCVVASVRAPGRGGEPLGRAAASAVIAVVALPWLPVLVDQVWGSGNGLALLRYTATGTIHPRFPPTAPAPLPRPSAVEAARMLGAITSLSRPRTAWWAGVGFLTGTPPSRQTDLVALVLVGMVGWLAWPHPRRRQAGRLAVTLARVGLLGWTIELVAAVRGTDQWRTYIVAPAAGVGLVLWLAVALAGTHALAAWAGPRLAPSARSGARIAVSVTAVAFLAFGPTQGVTAFRRQGDLAAERRVEERIVADTAGQRLELRLGAAPYTRVAEYLVSRLVHRDRNVAYRGSERAHYSDDQRLRPTDGARVLFLGPPGGAPRACAPLGRYDGIDVCLTDGPDPEPVTDH
jgi:hypothetical protein